MSLLSNASQQTPTLKTNDISKNILAGMSVSTHCFDVVCVAQSFLYLFTLTIVCL